MPPPGLRSQRLCGVRFDMSARPDDGVRRIRTAAMQLVTAKSRGVGARWRRCRRGAWSGL